MKRVSKQRLLAAKAELAELEDTIKKAQHRQRELRNNIADNYHTGDDGTQNFEVHGHEIKVSRKMNLSITKGNLALLEEEEPELFEEVTKTEVKLHDTSAKKRLDDLGDYVTMKQGLPVVTIKEIE
jgi:chromosome segregation ATPase|tara:strand:- start:6713 stop:7090 length:378 start_codon:yes stop_codon:yes gene_type:complete